MERYSPSVRGMVMNPVDHPLGGGEGAGKDVILLLLGDSLAVDTKPATSGRFRAILLSRAERSSCMEINVSRSVKKGPFIEKSLIKRLLK